MAFKFSVYIANLGKYNEGKLVGQWFDPPINWDNLAEEIGLNERYEEYAVHDYESPVPISEYTSISEINKLYEALVILDDVGLSPDVGALVQEWFSSVEELAEHVDDIVVYNGVADMTELAQDAVESGAVFGDLPDTVKMYLDYAAIGRDLEIDGNYLVTSNAIYEYNK